jgi:hypothetical protein
MARRCGVLTVKVLEVNCYEELGKKMAISSLLVEEAPGVQYLVRSGIPMNLAALAVGDHVVINWYGKRNAKGAPGKVTYLRKVV